MRFDVFPVEASEQAVARQPGETGRERAMSNASHLVSSRCRIVSCLDDCRITYVSSWHQGVTYNVSAARETKKSERKVCGAGAGGHSTSLETPILHSPRAAGPGLTGSGDSTSGAAHAVATSGGVGSAPQHGLTKWSQPSSCPDSLRTARAPPFSRL